MYQELLQGTSVSCGMVSHACFQKNETILSMQDSTGRCGLIVEGTAHLSLIDENGNEQTGTVLNAGDCFNEIQIPASSHAAGFIVADSDVRVTFINVKKALTVCHSHCEEHQELLNSIVLILSSCNKRLEEQLHVISKRTLREKLLAYLRIQQEYSEDGEHFTIPLTLSALASYICADRTALQRELRHMNDEGLIESKGRNFRITAPL